eukprot:NODE_8149_length_370_cov_26.495327_g6414_i0.p2 GENE.NODE_8149_length_370_cov_26.495327_g6414_i0~~NODE_8149_length_370_cov_26.495327_g6414_i0.p2  ORF type:complete len:62 (-),score=2.33 NODE_8149_length_370_cov_26.495327_g6414_i0:85-270(-)
MYICVNISILTATDTHICYLSPFFPIPCRCCLLYAPVTNISHPFRFFSLVLTIYFFWSVYI